jgi:hypothetical protein
MLQRSVTYKRKTLGLREEEEDERRAHSCENTEEDVRSVAQMRQHVWCDLANDEVVHPVG